MFGIPQQAVGAIVAALIAGVIALLGLIISKEQKVSEFRQQWIDALREDVAAVIAFSHGIHGSSVAGRPATQPLWDKVKLDATGIRQASARIRLRLNPRERNQKEKQANQDILAALKEYEGIFSSATPDFFKLPEISDKLLSAAQIVLKLNWDRVRSGEPVYRTARWVAVIVVVGGALALLLRLFVK